MFGTTAHQKRGLLRLIIVLSVPWIVGWGWNCGANIHEYNVAKSMHSYYEKEYERDRQRSMENDPIFQGVISLSESIRSLAQYSKEMYDAERRAWRAAEIAVGGPLGLFLFGVGILWVRQGFQRENKHPLP
jgi:hypothetical protein